MTYLRATLLFLIVASSSCTWPRGFLFHDEPIVACKTTCGVVVLSPVPPEWTCEAIQAHEDRAMHAFKQMSGCEGRTSFPLDCWLPPSDARFANACHAIGGWKVQVAPTRNFLNSQTGADEGGETLCGSGLIKVGNAPVGVGRLAHELAHAIQACAPQEPFDPADPFHAHWAPIWEALRSEGLPE